MSDFGFIARALSESRRMTASERKAMAKSFWAQFLELQFQKIDDLLQKNGFVADVTVITGDQSCLFQFLKDPQFCVDVYPDGSIVVLFEKDGRDHLYEIDPDDTEFLLDILKNEIRKTDA